LPDQVFSGKEERAEQYRYVKSAYIKAVDDGQGALMFAVFRGNLSEGISFNDEYCRAVVCVGIPYPMFFDAKVQAKMNYNKQRARTERTYMDGDKWYQLCAYRALNQALGRVIRHRHDYGALILLDARFVENARTTAQLSLWLRGKERNRQNPGVCNARNTSNALRDFFREAKEHAAVVAAQSQTPTGLSQSQDYMANTQASCLSQESPSLQTPSKLVATSASSVAGAASLSALSAASSSSAAGSGGNWSACAATKAPSSASSTVPSSAPAKQFVSTHSSSSSGPVPAQTRLFQTTSPASVANTNTSTPLSNTPLSQASQDLTRSFPDHLVCPLTLDLFKDPVILGSSGQTYERGALLMALSRKPNVDPKTNAGFEGQPIIIDNYGIRQAVEHYRDRGHSQ
jgi:hypothetical protein